MPKRLHLPRKSAANPPGESESTDRILRSGSPADRRPFDLLDALVAIKIQIEPGSNRGGFFVLSQSELGQLHQTVILAMASLKEIACDYERSPQFEKTPTQS